MKVTNTSDSNVQYLLCYDFKLIFSSLERFYHETNEIEETGCKTSNGTIYGWDEMKEVNSSWVGLSKDEIEKSKYM